MAAVTKEQLLTVKVQIIDAEALSVPEPERMRSYLQDQGWERCTEEGGKREVWQLPSQEGTYEILLPASKEYIDYPRRVVRKAQACGPLTRAAWAPPRFARGSQCSTKRCISIPETRGVLYGAGLSVVTRRSPLSSRSISRTRPNGA